MPLFKNRIHNTEPLMYIRIPINTHSPNRFFSIISLYYASLRIFNVIHHRSSQRLYWYVLAYVSVILMFYYFWHTSFIKNNTRFSKCFSFHQHISQRFFIDRRSTRNIYIAIESFYISLIPQHFDLTLFISSWATKSCSGFCHVRFFTYFSVANQNKRKS